MLTEGEDDGKDDEEERSPWNRRTKWSGDSGGGGPMMVGSEVGNARKGHCGAGLRIGSCEEEPRTGTDGGGVVRGSS